ncbi:hypothetical protein KHQ81_02880 [Mycoplasmatota bacterium]|nr:hypothetical protein KHQ81_02880 [Mycoplasmatota bacterium]
MKKLLFSLLFLFLVIGAGVQTYASTVLDSNIITLIQNGISEIVDTISPEDENIIDDDLNDFDAGDYIDDKNNQLIEDLTKYKDQKVKEANQKLTEYINQIKELIDEIYHGKTEEEKEKIDNKIDRQVEKYKQKIYNDLMKKLNK